MPSYRVDIPGKGSFRVDSETELTDGEAYYTVLRQLQPEAPPEPEAKPESGFVAGAKATKERLLGDVEALKAAFGVEGAAEKAAAYRREAQRIFKMPELTEHPIDFLTSLAGSSAPYMLAPIAAGAVANPLGAGAALAATGLASAAQFTGSGLSRQLEEGTRPEDLNLGAAVAAAVPSAALDIFALGKIPGVRNMIPGVKQIFGQAGIQIGNKEAAGILGRYVLPALKTAGIEGATEAGQAVLERLQAGLDITDEAARKEYFDNFLGGAVLGGALAVPGTMFEGSRNVAPGTPATPTAEPAAPIVPSAPATQEQAPAAAAAAPIAETPETVEQPVEEMSAPEIAEPTLRTETPMPEAPEPVAAPQGDVFTLMDQHDFLKSTLDPLALQIEEAQNAGDAAKAKELQAEYRTNSSAVDTLAEQIKELGGFTETRAEIEATVQKELKKIDSQIGSLTNKIQDYRRSDIRDYDAADKAEAKIERLKEERQSLLDDYADKQSILRVRGTPQGETIPLFDADMAVPEATNMLTQPEPEATDRTADIERKQAEADALLKELVAAKEPAADAETAKAVLAELNAARAELRELQELASRSPEKDFDDALRDAHGNVSKLSAQLQSLSPKALREQHITNVNRKSEQLNQLYADIDALRGGYERTVPPPTLFSKRNQLYTAASTGNMDAVRRLLDYDKSLEKQAAKEASPQEKIAKAMETRMNLPGRVSERVVFDDHYDEVMEKVEKLRNKITKPQGNAKASVYQRAEAVYAEIKAAESLLADPKATAVEKGNARRRITARMKTYEPLLNAMTKARDEIDALLRSLHTVEEKGTAEETAAKKQAETDRAGREFRAKSREQKRYEKQVKGTMKASPARVAQDLGVQTDEYKKAAAAIDKAKGLSEEEKTKRKATVAEAIGRNNPWYGSELMKQTRALKEAEAKAGTNTKAEMVALEEKAATQTRRESPALKAKVAELEKVIADENATAKEKDAAKKAIDNLRRVRASEGPTAQSKLTNLKLQQVVSKRTTQETRRVAKLGTMKTGTPESQERAASRQAAFEADLSEEKGSTYEYQQKQEALERIRKRKAAKEPTTAVGQALRTAADKKLQRDFEEGLASEKAKEQRGSEVESKDLTPTQVRLLERNKVTKALQQIKDDETNSDVNRAVAAALEVYLDATNVTIHDELYADEGYELLGQATSKQIDISRKGLTQETLLHEGVHAAAERVIQMAKDDITQLGAEQQAAYRELVRLYEAAKSDPAITSKNAKSSLSEFVAEALSNEKLQSQLRKKKWTLGNAFRSFTSYILEMIGVKNVDNMLDASIAAVESLMIPSSVGPKAEETAQPLAKDIGAVETAKNVFKFKSFTQPAPVSAIVATQPKVIDHLKTNFTGLAGRVEWVDKYAAISEAFAKGAEAKVISDLEATNAEYMLRFSENVSQFAQQALTNGRMQLVRNKTDAGVEYIYKSEAGANLMRVYEKLEKSGIKNSTELDNMFTVYMAGKRAKQVGWDKLWAGNPDEAIAEYAKVMAQITANPQIKDAFEDAAKEYRAFNNGLLDFAEQTGALTAEQVAEFKAMDYVPYYRINGGNGDVELMSDHEKIISIGNIKDEPQLKELVGDNTKILPLSVSAVQNAFLLTHMSLRNNSVRDTSFLLRKMGIASTISEGTGPAGFNTVRFKVKGVPHYVVIDSNLFGIPADLIVKGMEGIKTSMPFIVKLMGKPADWVRKFVTRSPTYAAKQLVRDPMTAWLTNGVSGVPVLNALREMGSMVAGRSDVEKKLMEAGAVSSNVYTGGKEDLDKFLRDVGVGKAGFGKWLARADAFALQADAATRAAIYRDSIAKGMSEQQALLRTLESMNFGRRGLSPTIQLLNTLIPFFNSQIQGLDVIYRAFKGKMPYSQRLEIQQKLAARGAILAIGSIAYAYMMQDDDAYKRAKPEERLANWFVRIPGVKDPVKIPVPFELGYIFKSLPEAVINMSAEDNRNKDITKGMGKLVWQSVPLALPAAIKPLVELYMNKSFFGGDIESQREINTLQPTARYRNTTTELAKAMGSVTGDLGLTPIKIDHLIRGYTGGLGVAFASILNPLMEVSDKATPSKDPHEWPLVGGLFQAAEGRGINDAAYDRMLEITQAKGTYKQLLQEGKREEAQRFLAENRHLIMKASMAGRVQQQLGEWSTQRRKILASPNLTQEQKDQRLDRLDMLSRNYAERFLRATE